LLLSALDPTLMKFNKIGTAWSLGGVIY